MEQNYGTNAGADDGSFAKMHKQRRMNLAGIWFAFFIPWLLFCAVASARTFSIRFTNPGLAATLILGAALVILASFVLSYQAIERKRHHDPRYQPAWYIFLSVTCPIAFTLAWAYGSWNWNKTMSMYYNLSQMNDYSDVDPARMRGQQIMDAGGVQFVDGSHLELKYSMGFRNDEVYCVAPITSAQAPAGVYDFWAVGLNCCSGTVADFQCGEYDNRRAHSGMRWMRAAQQPFFRLAVQQAEATYGIKSNYPLFFTWTEDPAAEQAAYHADGMKFLILGLFGYGFLQLGFVILASVAFTKIGAF